MDNGQYDERIIQGKLDGSSAEADAEALLDSFRKLLKENGNGGNSFC